MSTIVTNFKGGVGGKGGTHQAQKLNGSQGFVSYSRVSHKHFGIGEGGKGPMGWRLARNMRQNSEVSQIRKKCL